MAKFRTVDPEIWQHPSLRRQPWHVRHIYMYLITALADDEGRFVADAFGILECAFARHDPVSEEQVDQDLGILAGGGHPLIVLYGEGGDRYGALTGWFEHQYIDRRRREPSSLPPPDTEVQSWDHADKIRAAYATHTNTDESRTQYSTALNWFRQEAHLAAKHQCDTSDWQPNGDLAANLEDLAAKSPDLAALHAPEVEVEVEVESKHLHPCARVPESKPLDDHDADDYTKKMDPTKQPNPGAACNVQASGLEMRVRQAVPAWSEDQWWRAQKFARELVKLMRDAQYPELTMDYIHAALETDPPHSTQRAESWLNHLKHCIREARGSSGATSSDYTPEQRAQWHADWLVDMRKRAQAFAELHNGDRDSVRESLIGFSAQAADYMDAILEVLD